MEWMDREWMDGGWMEGEWSDRVLSAHQYVPVLSSAVRLMDWLKSHKYLHSAQVREAGGR